MRITTQGDYGLVCLLRIARQNGDRPISVREIADGERLPRHYVEKLVGRLRRAGLITSVRGPSGGYVLNGRPDQIAVKDVIDALEQSTFRINCYHEDGQEACVKLDSCNVGTVWAELKAHIDLLLGSLTLAMLLDSDRDTRQIIRTLCAEKATERARQPLGAAPIDETNQNRMQTIK